MECTPSREALLAFIRPDMESIPKEFFRRVYAFELTSPGFSEQAIAALEDAGCGRARQYYNDWVAEYKAKRDAESKEVARWYAAECEREWKKRHCHRRRNKYIPSALDKFQEWNAGCYIRQAERTQAGIPFNEPDSA